MGLLNTILNSYAKQTEMELNYQMFQEANAFNAQEAQKQRDWSSQEAQLAYERTLSADSTKYQRQVADLQAAGLNPMLAVSGGAGSVQSSPGSGQSASSVAPLRANLGDLMTAELRNQELDIQRKLADAEIALKNAQTKNVDADTVSTEVQTEFFRSTADVRAVLLGDEHERNQWEKEIGLRGVEVRERNQSMLEQQASHYNAYLDEEAGLIHQQNVSEEVKREMYRANARESNMNAAYKAAMLEVDKELSQAKSSEARNSAELLKTEARIKNGIYTPEYIRAVCKEAKAEAEFKDIEAAYKKGDYSSASAELQKVLKKLEKEGKGQWFTPEYGSVSVNSAKALPGLQ